MPRTESGQALIEWVLLAPLFAMLTALALIYGQWFVIRHRLLLAAREAALLYSSGRVSSAQTKNLVRQALRRGFPSLDVPLNDIFVGRRNGFQARLFQFDEARVRFRKFKTMEESCVIKHAPPYGAAGIPGVNYGPPFAW